jgi:hypothetical protein
MNDKIKQMVDLAIAKKGKVAVAEQMTNMLHESYRIKASFEVQGQDLGNIPEHIDMALEVIEYIKSL